MEEQVDVKNVDVEKMKDHFSTKAEESGRRSLAKLVAEAFRNSFFGQYLQSREKKEEERQLNICTDLQNFGIAIPFYVEYTYRYSQKWERNRVTMCTITCEDEVVGYGRAVWWPQDEYDVAEGNRQAFLKAINSLHPRLLKRLLGETYFKASSGFPK
jgi:hypothetical protein